MPRPARALLYLTFGGPSAQRSGYAKIRHHEEGHSDGKESHAMARLLPRDMSTGGSRLREVLADDRIAKRIARHLHFIDISNLSSSSRDVWSAMYQGSGSRDAKRVQMLCEMACVGGKKSECWACARLICNVRSSALPHHRTYRITRLTRGIVL